MNKKFNCTFSVTGTIEKTYVVTNLPISIPEEDLPDMTSQTIKDVASNIIHELLANGAITIDKGTLIQADHDFNFVEFVKTPKEIKED